MHTVAVLALDDVIPFDLATPVEVFGRLRLADGQAPYQVLVCGDAVVRTEVFTLQPPHDLATVTTADTVVVPGVAAPWAPVPDAAIDALRTAAANGARIASICVGAFTLAAAGLLDGLRATTHWLGTQALADRYPAVEVDPNVLYVDNGRILTSAGAAAGLDLCLHMIRKDHGSAVAAEAARLAVMPLEREGGQAQFVVHDHPPTPRGTELDRVLAWLDANADQDLTLREIAAEAGMSTRTLNRRFREQTGTTPLQWLHRTRVRKAQYLLEHTSDSVDRIGGRVGFASPTTFRDRFRRVVGTTPNAYRATFRGSGQRFSAASADHATK